MIFDKSINEIEKGCRKDRTWEWSKKEAQTKWKYCGEEGYYCLVCQEKLEKIKQLSIEVEDILDKWWENIMQISSTSTRLIELKKSLEKV